jgi:hypothetical protein
MIVFPLEYPNSQQILKYQPQGQAPIVTVSEIFTKGSHDIHLIISGVEKLMTSSDLKTRPDSGLPDHTFDRQYVADERCIVRFEFPFSA